MLPIDKLTIAGEHAFFFEGAVGKLEGTLMVPPFASTPYVAILGHPHSLQGGSQTNKVVTTMARAFKELGIPSLRFNFRGVGLSEGVYDDGLGESEDMVRLMEQWELLYPNARFLLAGFSFGSYVTYRAAALFKHDVLLSIAPPVHHYNYQEFLPAPNPWHIFQGTDDEVVPYEVVLDFVKQSETPIAMRSFNDTTHFFHGKLLMLKADLMTIVREHIHA